MDQDELEESLDRALLDNQDQKYVNNTPSNYQIN